MKRLSIFIASVAMLAMIGSSCSNRRACEALRKELAALECGAVFSLDTIYKRPFDSVYIHGPYSSVENPAYARRSLKKSLRWTLAYDHRSALIFVRNGKVAGYCVTETSAESFRHIRRGRNTPDTVLSADTKYLIACDSIKGEYITLNYE